MSAKGFQIEVTSRSRPGKQVFAVAAASQLAAEMRLEKDRRLPPDPVFNLRRLLSEADFEKHRLADGDVAQLS